MQERGNAARKPLWIWRQSYALPYHLGTVFERVFRFPSYSKNAEFYKQFLHYRQPVGNLTIFTLSTGNCRDAVIRVCLPASGFG